MRLTPTGGNHTITLTVAPKELKYFWKNISLKKKKVVLSKKESYVTQHI